MPLEQAVRRPELKDYQRRGIEQRLIGAELRGLVFESVLYGNDPAQMQPRFVERADIIVSTGFDRWARRTGVPEAELPAAREAEALRIHATNVKAATTLFERKGRDGLAAETVKAKREAAELAHQLGWH